MSSAESGGVLADAPSAEMERIMEANRAVGHHFFEPATMRFFNSTLYPRVYGGRYFITGERFELPDPERFTIRIALDKDTSTRSASSRTTRPMRPQRTP